MKLTLKPRKTLNSRELEILNTFPFIFEQYYNANINNIKEIIKELKIDEKAIKIFFEELDRSKSNKIYIKNETN